jgi:hypothetical protein
MSVGKKKCELLKNIRKEIALRYDISYTSDECSFKGECKGTCPKCEAELRYLERELERKKNLGRAVCVVGISASVCTGFTACNPIEDMQDFWDVLRIGADREISGTAPAPVLSGDVEIMPESTEVPEIDIDGGIMMPEDINDEDIIFPGESVVPEEIEGDVEILEGDISLTPEEMIIPEE